MMMTVMPRLAVDMDIHEYIHVYGYGWEIS